MTTPYWLAKPKYQLDKKVKSLLHFDTNLTNNTNRSFDIIGNPQISNTRSKFNKSLYLDGSSYLSTPITYDLNLSTGDFTIEWWEYRTNTTINLTALTFDTGTTSGTYDFILGRSNGTNVLCYASSNNSSWNILNGLSLGAISLNQWAHYTLVRSGNVFTTYKNGTKVATATSNLPINFGNLTELLIGNSLSSVNGVYVGYIDEVRISNTARYTANFTPSAVPFVEDANTSLLLHFDEEFTNFYKDELNRTWSTTGTPKLSTSDAKLGSKSLYLEGNASIQCTSSEFNFGVGDFTVEAFVLGGAQAIDYPTILSSNINGNGSLFFADMSNWHVPSFQCGGEVVVKGGTVLSDSIWHHIALTRQNGVFYFFVDGVLNNSNSSCLTSLVDLTNLTLGICPYSTSDSQFNGYIDELRISNNAKYITNFTPPTAPLSLNTSGNYWSFKTNSWVDVGLPTTDAGIATLFVNQGTNTCPTQQQLELLGTGVNRPNRCCYQTSATTQPTININAVPTGKTVKPTELLPITSIDGIDSVSIAKTITTGTAKLAVTLDLVTYYKFNGSTWVVVDINTNQANMMDIATVTSINRSQWDLLTNGTASGIAFAYYLDIGGIGDTVKIDKTSLVVDMKGEWSSAIKGSDFKYGYPTNDRLKVTLLTTGNYKINYVGG